MSSPVKILSAAQLREADAYTIAHEPISSLDLMERAASHCAGWIMSRYDKTREPVVLCGTGNNGGDGLAIARLLHRQDYQVHVYIVGEGKCSDDFAANLERLHQAGVRPVVIREEDQLPLLTQEMLLVDCLFGTGLSRSPDGIYRQCVEHMNRSQAEIISIDLPSGLFAHKSSRGNAVVRASQVLTFQAPKLAFMFPENQDSCSSWQVLDIGLDKAFIDSLPSSVFYLTHDFIAQQFRPRSKFSHKGTFGHVLIAAGSYGKMGAAVLSGKACLKSGCGLLTMLVPACGYQVIQVSIPEAMVLVSGEKQLETVPDPAPYKAIAAGPGVGTAAVGWLRQLIRTAQVPLVLDADALNILAANRPMLDELPEGSILTPHPKEFERLAGAWENDFERHEKQKRFSETYRVFVVLKGAHTCITGPSGICCFNSTGNPGMAKGGSGDVLTGVTVSLLAQGYDPVTAASVGVYIHGLAGDLAAAAQGQTGMTASDIAGYLPQAFSGLEEGA